MKHSKHLSIPLLLALALAAVAPTIFAQDKASTVQTSVVQDMADGEIRKIDQDAKKITLRHGEIKNLEMPPMTMVFQVKDLALLEGFKVGDKVKFAADKLEGGFFVTALQVKP